MNIRDSKKFCLRVLSGLMLSLIVIVLLITILFVYQRVSYRQQFQAKDGYLSLNHTTVYEEPVYMSGQWEVFEGVICNSSKDVAKLKKADEYISFPIASIVDAEKDATYRLRFSVPKEQQSGLNLYIPIFFEDTSIYLNGVKLNHVVDGETWLRHASIESVYKLDSFNSKSEWQELVITGSFSSQDTTLYKRGVIIGTMKNIAALSEFTSSNEMFLFGALLLILINGYVFMMFRPTHKIISYMTLFDTMILLRSVFSMNYVMSFAKDIIPFFTLSDRFSTAAAMFFLMIGGIVGCKLSSAIYDPNKEVSQWFIEPLPWIYGLFAITLPFFPSFFESYGKYMLIVVYIFTFIGIFLQYKVSRKNKERRTYNLLQLIKTIYIGSLIFLDILFWDLETNLLLLFYLYGAFFVLHVVVRLYDNNKSYQYVEILNEDLEDTVKIRTKELSEANRILSELSIRDQLTNVFNRLYFERAMEEIEMNSKDDMEVYLCMFDLDSFKEINDTYGHIVGDEQLKAMAMLVSNIVGDKAIFARFGGEEFILLFKGVKKEDVIAIVRKLYFEIQKDIKVNQHHTTASFGISTFHENETSEILLKRADLAMYEAKKQGRNCIVTNFADTFVTIEKPSSNY